MHEIASTRARAGAPVQVGFEAQDHPAAQPAIHGQRRHARAREHATQLRRQGEAASQQLAKDSRRGRLDREDRGTGMQAGRQAGMSPCRRRGIAAHLAGARHTRTCGFISLGTDTLRNRGGTVHKQGYSAGVARRCV